MQSSNVFVNEGGDDDCENLKSLLDYSRGIFIANSMEVMLKLDIFGRVGKTLDASRSVESLAAEVNVDADALYRVMRALSKDGMFRELSPRVFSNSPRSIYLARDKTLHSYFLMRGREPSFWDHLEKNPDTMNLFADSMSSLTSLTIHKIIGLADFSKFKIVTDLGGSKGVLLKEILKVNKNIEKGINFDMVAIIEKNKHVNSIESGEQLDSRYVEVGGSFFESVPESDCYVLKSILHDWSEDKCIEILKTASKSLRQDGRIYIIDYIIDDQDSAHEKLASNFIAWLDVNMLQLFGGRERNLKEWHDLVDKAGFQIESIKRSQSFMTQPLIILTKKT
ncbi:O-methyltransferase family 2 protein [Heterostelium album PN500]|uniref:O-methyltransferase family 2 protein n=1 Tax=Heterostelium pallidum (strain ATCC 26659 / Pp 5 / PN500) TaxID=670386 RepID=D3B3Z1_HETP5|nr:O-methyltransferase family 2 protein [Heterostelium album PN500]EFA84039.1 O-methyltransferase family 2 protein [Heterostelium album PN500]|eukprot:XP_020436156.1 O-methyltransferase family 2 protein [Heterostelium album PN500]